MIEPLKVGRNNFPRSKAVSKGMKLLNVTVDNNQMSHVRDIVYVRRGDISLSVQLIMPDPSDKKPPLIVYVTGSAFHWQNIPDTLPRLAYLANRGFAIASVQYRGSENAAFPAQMLDVKAAVRFMKSQADKYGYDRENVFLMGDSSGGHTVLMAGLTAGIAQFEEDIYAQYPSTVKGIIDFYGPVDITKMNDEPSVQDHTVPESPEGLLIGGKNVLQHPELTDPTVVTNYITEDRPIPPILIMHGTNDELVAFGQSCMLHDKLKACNKQADFYAVEGAHHGGKEFWCNQTLDIVTDFINKNSK